MVADSLAPNLAPCHQQKSCLSMKEMGVQQPIDIFIVSIIIIIYWWIGIFHSDNILSTSRTIRLTVYEVWLFTIMEACLSVYTVPLDHVQLTLQYIGAHQALVFKYNHTQRPPFLASRCFVDPYTQILGRTGSQPKRCSIETNFRAQASTEYDSTGLGTHTCHIFPNALKRECWNFH